MLLQFLDDYTKWSHNYYTKVVTTMTSQWITFSDIKIDIEFNEKKNEFLQMMSSMWFCQRVSDGIFVPEPT